ncbi:protein dead ringer isoform X2 [Amyelois transitella]|uniref:protein dead ringer isoform X2 n=1 Tax=Amyelois transitella TaxID=680683 RepID=UPI00298F5FB6|nr:protein dead ringer isoform X2 [Amyelois transitella]
MADADRDSDLGDDSPVSARSEGESSADQSCESSDEGVGRDAPAHQPLQLQHQAHQPLPHQPQHNMNHHTVNHQPINNHQLNHHQRNSPRPHERELKVRDDFESLKTSLHPHLSSLASLAQGAPLSAPSSVFALAGGGPPGGFPYAPPAFLAPAPPPPAQPAGSASSSSSEGSAAGWSFEEQYKQVRQLYEISDDPQRKEFLDDLFSFMQKRGTPINRLPIMAKSVLDLYELYNLVIARGGLVEVINKKLWQEIIKGLRLPSSITSAAFTLRTQYMKYLYEYECDKKNLSTRTELDAAIEGNKREGRRTSGQYDAQAALGMPTMSRGIPPSFSQLTQHMQPLSLSLGGGVPGVPRLPPMPQHMPLTQQELELRVREYMKMINHQRELMRNGSESPPSSGPPMISPRDAAALSAIDVSRLTLWSLYNNNNNSPQPELEPQREALNLSESPNCTNGGKREACRSPPPPAKRRASRPPSPRSPPPTPQSERGTPAMSRASLTPQANGPPTNGVTGAAFKITTRGDANTGDQQLVVSIEINGVTYEGVLFPSQNGNGQNSHRPMVS